MLSIVCKDIYGHLVQIISPTTERLLPGAVIQNVRFVVTKTKNELRTMNVITVIVTVNDCYIVHWILCLD
jgi:hypothetical protein